MKFWILVGLFSAAAIPMASASERPMEAHFIQVEMRRADERVEPPVSPTPQRVVGPTQRDGGSPATTTTVQRPTEPTRRRGGSRKRVPDAVLMAPRGAL